MSRLWLLRHACPLVDSGVCYGRLDVAADAGDTQQAAENFVAALTAQAAKDFSAPLPSIAALRHSPLQRCEQLAHSLIALQPDFSHNTCVDARLQEMDFGAWEGLPWEAIARSAIDAWAADLAGHAPGDGECLATMLQRVQQALQHSWAVDSQQGARDVVWVTHAGVIRCVQWLLLHGQQPPTSADWMLPAPGFGQWLVLPWADSGPALQRLGAPVR